MLTRHSPLHALGYAEAGWLVGESGGHFRHADCCTTARVFTQNRSSSSQDTLRGEPIKNQNPFKTGPFRQNEKNPAC
jgi:hypothetical protein